MSGPASAGENPVSLFRERLDAAAADPCTRAVVVRINSPGGGVTASDIMRHDLERFKENTRMPVIACLMDIGASGGYYLATAADQIVAHPTTVTGGIGVILNLYNLAGVEEKYDIGYIPIKSPLGGNIDSGTVMTSPRHDGCNEQAAEPIGNSARHSARHRQPISEPLQRSCDCASRPRINAE